MNNYLKKITKITYITTNNNNNNKMYLSLCLQLPAKKFPFHALLKVMVGLSSCLKRFKNNMAARPIIGQDKNLAGGFVFNLGETYEVLCDILKG